VTQPGSCYHPRVADQALKWWHVRWARIAVLFGAIFAGLWLIVGIGYGVLFLTAPWRQAQRLAKGWPQLAMVPANLTTQAQAPLSNTSIDRYGFKFLLPNREISKTRGFDSIIAASFPNGGGLMVENPSDEPGIGLISPAFRRDKRAEKLLGRELLQSNFKLMQAAMSTTPDQVKWWRFRSSQNQRAEALLTLKFVALVMCKPPFESASPIYAISFGQFHGFQCGNPDAPPYNAHIEVFDGADRHFAMTIAGQRGHGQVITQEELNAMVASIRPSPGN